MSNCYICTTPITDENKSKEHIILNAIGGKLKSYDLLCNVCNSKIGHEADSELAKQFQFMSGYLQVKRDNGKIPDTTGGKLKDGTAIDLVDGITPRYAKPKYEATPTEDGITYNIMARDDKEMKQILTGLKKKHPGLDIEESMKVVKRTKSRLKEPVVINQTFGGDLAFRSIAKSAINFYIHNNGARKNILHLIPYIEGKEELDIVKHYHPLKSIYKKDAGEIIHMIHLVGSKREKTLYCFIEFFSTHSYLILLSNDYEGSNLTFTYAYNLITNTDVKKKVDLKLSAAELSNMETKFSDFPQVKEKSDRFMKITTKIQTDAIISNITSTAIRDIFEIKYGHEKFVTPQMTNELSARIAIDMVEFLNGSS